MQSQDTGRNRPSHKARSRGPKLKVIRLHRVNKTIQNSVGETSLHKACYSGRINVKLIDYSFQKKPNTNLKNAFGKTQLHIASSVGTVEEVERLLGQGANVNAQDNLKRTPAHMAIRNKSSYSILKVLVLHKANVNLQNSEGLTPLHMASFSVVRNLPVIDLLLDNNAKINLRDTTGKTALHNASYVGAVEVVERLLLRGADVNAQDSSGITPVHVAIDYGRTSVLQVLLSNKANVNLESSTGLTPLHVACNAIDRNLQIIDLLLKNGANINHKDAKGKTALHKASDAGGVEVAEILLARGADVNLKDSSFCTPAHLATAHGHISVLKVLLVYNANLALENSQSLTPLHIACLKGDKNALVVELLLEANANPNSRVNYDNRTLLHTCSFHGFPEIVRRLLMRSADVNAQDNAGDTPTHVAGYHGHVSVLKVLVAFGANINLQNSEGMTPLQKVCNVGDPNLQVVEFLLDNNAKTSPRDTCGRTVLHKASLHGASQVVRLLLMEGADVNALDSFGNTPAHMACTNGHSSVLRVLLEYKANINLQNSEGLTPLHNACDTGSQQVIHILLESNAAVDVQSNSGDTALHLLASHFHCVNEKLLKKGASIDVRNNQGKTPYDYCLVDNRYAYIVEYNRKQKFILEKHIVKLKTASLPVDINFNTDSEKFINIKADCIKELDKMKATKINGLVFLNEFLNLKNSGCLRNIETFQELDKKLSSKEFFNEFPLYGHILENNVRKAKQRLDLEEAALNSFHSENRNKIWSMGLPHEVKLEILNYLSNDDLRRFLESE